MAGGRDAIRMTDAEVDAFLLEQRKLQVATNGPHGVPHLTTLFHVVHDGRIAFWTYARSQKVRNLERDPRLSALVEDGTAYDELRGVSITGRAELVRDPDLVREIGLGVAVRMVGARSADDLGELGRDMVEQQVPKRVGVVVHPVQVASWDHAKM